MNALITFIAQATQPLIKQENNCKSNDNSDSCISVLPKVAADQGQIQNILAVLFGILGALAVIFIIVAAINIATADGNPEKIGRAKRTIIFALIGLVIAVSAETIVFTVVNRL
jgi:hypothetical protein